MNRAYRDYCRHMGAAMFQRPIFTDPTLSNEELLTVYQTAKSTDLYILRDTAVQMFPERFEEKPPQLYTHQGGATAFRHHGVVTRPERTIGAAPMNQIGIMADGMAYPY